MFDELKSRMNKFWNDDRTLAQTDPEFVELFSNFAYDEVVNEPGANHPDLDDSTRSMAILAALIGCQGLDDFELMVPVAFESGVGRPGQGNRLPGGRISRFRPCTAVPEKDQ